MDYMGGSVPDTALLRLRFYFCYVKHSKNLNVPFPRPFGATGNDARKLHAHGFARFCGVLSAHEVLRPSAASISLSKGYLRAFADFA